MVVTLDQARQHRGRAEIDLLRARRNPDASLRSDIGDAIAWAIDALQKAPPKKKVLVLLTDGRNSPARTAGPPPMEPEAAAELARVCRPGGLIALASWTPDGFIGETFRVFARHLPPATGLQPPIRWGDPGYLDSLLVHVAASMSSQRRTAVFRFRSPEENVDFFRTHYGPTLRAFESLDPPRRESLRNDLVALARRYDRNGGTGPIAITADYLESVIVRK